MSSDRLQSSTQGEHPPLFSAILAPHRSLSPTGFKLLMAFIGTVSLVTGVWFAAHGAWPVLGFFGLDVALIWLAFKLSYRSGRAFETVEIRDGDLHVTQVSAAGLATRRTFNAYWARLDLSEWPSGRTELRLGSHGQSILIAQCLNDDERRDFASALRSALAKSRSSSL